MGNPIVGVGRFSIPVLLAALFIGENDPKQLSPKDDHVTPVVNSSVQTGNTQQTIAILQNLFSGFNPIFHFNPGPIISEPDSEPDNEYALAFRSANGFEGREVYLGNLLKTLNPQLLSWAPSSKEETALSAFNKKNDLSLVCMGIKNKPTEFVFIDNNYFLGKTQIPTSIALTLQEVIDIKSKKDLMQLLENKLLAHRREMLEQDALWAKPYTYDFPKNNTASMFTLSLSGLSGMETDLVALLDVSKSYGMSVDALCIDNLHKDTLSGLLEKRGSEGLPEMVPATRNEILNQLEKSLKKAIDEKKSAFLFHYLQHGSEDGRIGASDGTIKPEEIAERISSSYKGRPLCDQIDITIWAGSCYSGKQLDGIKHYFQQKRDIPVKNLRIVTESLYTTAGAGTNPENASLVSDLMTDNSGPLDYYRSWYREYLQYLESKGLKVQEPVKTYVHEVRFADLMTRIDTSSTQDAQGFHYSNDPKKGKIIEQYFTQLKPIISENQSSDGYAMLENSKDKTITV